MLVVIDTNVLVSALWSRNGSPAKIISLVINGNLIPCYDHRIMNEYQEVLKRPKFGFSEADINALLGWFTAVGHSVIAEPLPIDFVDESDKKFYEVAKFCRATLITGNLKHYPNDPSVVSVPDFLTQRNL